MDFSELVNIYLEVKKYHSNVRIALRDFATFLGTNINNRNAGNYFKKATIADTFRFVNLLKNQGTTVAPLFENHPRQNLMAFSTIQQRIVQLRLFYDFLISQKFCEVNPFHLTPKTVGTEQDRRPHRCLSLDEIKKIFDALDTMWHKERNKAILGLLFAGALRRGEIPNIRVCDLEKIDNTYFLHIHKQKNKQYSKQEIHSYANPYLDDFLSKKNRASDELLFNVTDHVLNRLFRTLQTKLDFHFTSHDCRTTAITMLFEAGIPAQDIMIFSRHSDIRTTLIYDKRIQANSEILKKVSFG